MAEQIPLQFEYRVDQTFGNFITGPNQEIIAQLKACVDHTGEPFLFLWGGCKLGKSHLLQACCHRAFAQHRRAFYLPANQQDQHAPAILDGLEAMDIICIDNIEGLTGNADWELALFNLFNRLRADNKCLIITSHCSPTQLSVQLPDLQTRLGWGLALKLQALNDQDMIAALTLKAQTMGFDIPEKSAHFILTHYSRDAQVLWDFLQRLDYATLAAQRKVTIPFLKQLLAL